MQYTVNVTWDYQLEHMDRNIKELRTGDLSNVNALELFLGSYQVKVYGHKDVFSKNIILTFEVHNTTGLESLTRFRRPKDGVNQGILKDKPVGEGVRFGGTMKQTYGWQEIYQISN